jgi:aspartyl-tRNA(Asn)/glutamyl-tRNA(Gln) amidotransferase subunit A
VSRYGLIALASSLDQIGPFARTVSDAAAALSILAGVDSADATTAPEMVPDFGAALTGDIRGVRVGVPNAVLQSGVDEQVIRAFHAALDVLRGAGAKLVDIGLPHAQYAVPVYYLVMTAEASSNLARYDGVRYGHRAAGTENLKTLYSRTRDEGFGAEAKRRIMLGTYVLSAGYYDAYYLKAQQVRTLLRRDYDQAFEKVDVVAVPTSPTAAFRLGEKTSDPLQMYLADIFTVSANLTGSPALSIPCGFTSDRLPIGLQLTGRMFDESTLLRVGDAYERVTDWHTHAP